MFFLFFFLPAYQDADVSVDLHIFVQLRELVVIKLESQKLRLMNKLAGWTSVSCRPHPARRRPCWIALLNSSIFLKVLCPSLCFLKWKLKHYMTIVRVSGWYGKQTCRFILIKIHEQQLNGLVYKTGTEKLIQCFIIIVEHLVIFLKWMYGRTVCF